MTDQRLTPANVRVAASALKGFVDAPAYVEGVLKSVVQPLVNLCAAPNGPRNRQLLLGAQVTVFEEYEGWAFIQSVDGYVGYVTATSLGPHVAVTHFVATPATHAYLSEDFKSPDLMRLSFGARVAVLDERKKYFETPQGFIPKKHLRPMSQPFSDPVTVAQLHFGVPYLWGGNAIDGIDCSGLVAAALLACGIPCPADSDLQRAQLGTPLDKDAPLQRGDLVFWKGHVGLMVDEHILIHANAHHMSTVYEPIDRAILRIATQGDGDVLIRKRLTA
ncbi:MAG: NlpC/P60 family protein [Yoonia sp.]|nr:NlpC/P60 family protein [Yoonia sp.]MDG1862966.1 NlpC/P60 family protein [Yoonia sp.]